MWLGFSSGPPSTSVRHRLDRAVRVENDALHGVRAVVVVHGHVDEHVQIGGMLRRSGPGSGVGRSARFNAAARS